MTNSLIKISAAGNKFLIADQRWFQAAVPSDLASSSYQMKYSFEDFLKLNTCSLEKRKHFLTQLLSSQELALTDGVIVLKDFESSFPVYHFYNRDGSQPEMCGNAACCLISYAQQTKIIFKKFQLVKEKIQAVQNLEGDWAISLSQKPQFKKCFSFQFQSQNYDYDLMESGVPHAVLEWKKPLDKESIRPLAQALRFQNSLSSAGMNVSFYQVQSKQCLKAITFERGVEDFTLACGTGALAVAFSFYNKQQLQQKNSCIKIEMPGGCLKVQVQDPVCLFSPVKWSY